MRRPRSWWLVPPMVLAAACGKPGDKGGSQLATDSAAVEAVSDSATGAPAAAAGPQAIVTVIYNQPKDTTAFEKYYSATHLPLVSGNQQQIGFTRADLTRFEANLDGSKPAKYRQAELCFDSMDALRKGVATAGFKKVGGDLKNFATGGLAALIGEQQ